MAQQPKTRVKIVYPRYIYVSQVNRNILYGELVTPELEVAQEKGKFDTMANLLRLANQENLEVINAQEILHKLVAIDGYAS